MVLQIDSVWGWASPPLRLQLAGGSRGPASGGAGAGAAATAAAAAAASSPASLAAAPGGPGGSSSSTASSSSSSVNCAQSSGQRMGEMVIERAPSPARLSHTSEKHPRATLTELNVLRRHRELCDVVLNVGTRKIFAHRVILSACSPYFR